MSHHDRRVKRGEIECGNGMGVEASSWLNDNGTFIFALICSFTFNRDQKIMLPRLAIELRGDLDLLTSCEEISDGNTSDTSHLSLVEQTHQLLHKSKRQICILDTVDRQSSPCELITILK